MFGRLGKLKIGTKLTAVMAGFVTVNVLVMSVMSYGSMRAAVEHQAGAKLEAVAKLQASEFEQALKAIDRDLALQAEHPFVIEALGSFTRGFHAISDPQQTLQTAYIEKNPNPLSQKDKLRTAGRGSAYDQAHERFHPSFDALQDAMGYYDIFLFDADGDLVYSVFKELDYATNLVTGEWAQSGLGEVFRKAMSHSAADGAAFIDFAPYGPSAGAPAAFVGRPVFAADGTRLGVLAYQMPIDVLNETVSHATGIGQTGDAFLVGADRLLRTDSRLTDADDVLQRRFESPALAEGVAGRSGLMGYTNVAGVPVLGYYTPIETFGTGWVMIVQQSMDELLAQV